MTKSSRAIGSKTATATQPYENGPVETWTEDVLSAASINVGLCDETSDCQTVGVDMITVDGITFAHGHFDLAAAEGMHARLGECIAWMKRRRN